MINIIRDPVTWSRSSYNFCRHGWEKDQEYKGHGCMNLSKEQTELTFEDCVRQDKPECVSGSNSYLNWLCGDQKACGKISVSKMSKAKWNVEHNYQVVGLLERIEDTLKLLEVQMPEFFKGALEIYKTEALKKVSNASKSINPGDDTVPKDVRDKITDKKLKYEMMVYQHAEKIFDQKMAKAGLKKL